MSAKGQRMTHDGIKHLDLCRFSGAEISTVYHSCWTHDSSFKTFLTIWLYFCIVWQSVIVVQGKKPDHKQEGPSRYPCSVADGSDFLSDLKLAGRGHVNKCLALCNRQFRLESWQAYLGTFTVILCGPNFAVLYLNVLGQNHKIASIYKVPSVSI